ncbi:hypothetical protein NXC14_PC00794 (plasmid) [Rhizobium sp. NXC14]|nr:hypothetical protein NXC14_PC00794 [Rhizobium sp. NXC14]
MLFATRSDDRVPFQGLRQPCIQQLPIRLPPFFAKEDGTIQHERGSVDHRHAAFEAATRS